MSAARRANTGGLNRERAQNVMPLRLRLRFPRFSSSPPDSDGKNVLVEEQSAVSRRECFDNPFLNSSYSCALRQCVQNVFAYIVLSYLPIDQIETLTIVVLDSKRPSKMIRPFKYFPIELFRVSNGLRTRLRAVEAKSTKSFDIFTESGLVVPRALDPATYKGD